MSNTPLKMISSMATRELLGELAAQFQQRSGRVVAAEAAGGVDVAKRVEQGEPFDVVVLASNAIDKLIASGRVLSDSRADLVESGVAIAVREGTQQPAVASEAEVKAAVLAAPTLSYSTGPSGVYLEKLFERWGILEQIRSRIVVPPPGTPVGSLVADGRAALGFQQLSELLNVAGVAVLGPLPPAIQTLTIFSGGICASSKRPDEGRALLRYMASAETEPLKRRHGMQPAH